MNNLKSSELNFIKNRIVANNNIFSKEEKTFVIKNIKCISKVYKIGYLDGKK